VRAIQRAHGRDASSGDPALNLLRLAAKRFIAGETIDDAVRAVRDLNDQGCVATLDNLGENVADPAQATAAAAEYVRIFDTIHEKGLQCNASVKLTQMGLDLGEEVCLANVRRVLRRAKERKNFVRLDMEGSAYTQRTLDTFERLRGEGFDNVGVVIQAMLRRSEADVKRLTEAGASVRLCKGAYKEPLDKAFQKMSEIRENFVRLLDLLLRGKGRVGIATHDPKLQTAAQGLLARLGTPRDRYEFQMLYGIRRETQLELVRHGHPVRIYVPYGTHWLPYTIRRLRERKENLFFILGSLFRK
jgi:proline dehydrogenase